MRSCSGVDNWVDGGPVPYERACSGASWFSFRSEALLHAPPPRRSRGSIFSPSELMQRPWPDTSGDRGY